MRSRGSAGSEAEAAPAVDGDPRRAFTLPLDGRELLVISAPSGEAQASRLSLAEREIARLVLGGASNAEIAARRGTAVRTVANQVASLFRTLGVGSRAELAAMSALTGLEAALGEGDGPAGRGG